MGRCISMQAAVCSLGLELFTDTISLIPNEGRLLPHIHTVDIAPTFIRYCGRIAPGSTAKYPLGGGSNQIGDLCMGCFPKLMWVVSLSTARCLSGRNTSAVLMSRPPRRGLISFWSIERYLCWIVDWAFENQSRWNCYLIISNVN